MTITRTTNESTVVPTIKMTVHTCSRRILQQVAVRHGFTDVEFSMLKWDGWIAAGAIRKEDWMQFLGHIGERYYLFPCSLVNHVQREQMLHNLPQIYVP